MYQFIQPQTNNLNYTAGQTWGALKKAWRGYKIARYRVIAPEWLNMQRRLEHFSMTWESSKQSFQN
jgi:hypothetical protein